MHPLLWYSTDRSLYVCVNYSGTAVLLYFRFQPYCLRGRFRRRVKAEQYHEQRRKWKFAERQRRPARKSVRQYGVFVVAVVLQASFFYNHLVKF